MAWNGLYYEGALAVRDALMINKHLVEIDISHNRINWEGALFLAEMLEKNCYLEILKVRIAQVLSCIVVVKYVTIRA